MACISITPRRKSNKKLKFCNRKRHQLGFVSHFALSFKQYVRNILETENVTSLLLVSLFISQQLLAPQLHWPATGPSLVATLLVQIKPVSPQFKHNFSSGAEQSEQHLFPMFPKRGAGQARGHPPSSIRCSFFPSCFEAAGFAIYSPKWTATEVPLCPSWFLSTFIFCCICWTSFRMRSGRMSVLIQ